MRVTPSGAKPFIFEAKLHRETIRQTIGCVRSWSIEEARTGANRLRVLVDSGTNPRELRREQEAAAAARKAERTEALEDWIHHYNWHRPHQGIGGVAPMSRLNKSRNNLLTLHT